jgi:hypothetical protein
MSIGLVSTPFLSMINFSTTWGMGSEWGKEHEYRNSDQNCVWYFIKNSQYGLLML